MGKLHNPAFTEKNDAMRTWTVRELMNRYFPLEGS